MIVRMLGFCEVGWWGVKVMVAAGGAGGVMVMVVISAVARMT